MTPLGEFEHLVLLAVLRLDSEASGVGIARELEEQAERQVSRGALYTTLDRLEAKKLVRWKLASGGRDRGGLPCRIYTPTARGLAALRRSHAVLQRMWRGLDDVLKATS